MKNQHKLKIFESLAFALKIFPRAALPLLFIVTVSFLFGYVATRIAEIIEPQSLVLGACWFVFCSFVTYLMGACAFNVSIKRAQRKNLQASQFYHAFNPSIAWRLLVLGIIPFFIYQVWFKLVIKNIYLYEALFSTSPNSVFDWLILPYYIGNYSQIVLYYFYLLFTLSVAVYIATRTFLSVCFVLDKNAGLISSLKQAFRVTKQNVLKIIALVFLPPVLISLIQIGFILLCNFLLESIIWQNPAAYYLFVMGFSFGCALAAILLAYLLTGVIYVKLSK